jgi:hypothetical protein
MPCHIIVHGALNHITIYGGMCHLLEESSTLEVASLGRLSIYLARVDLFDPPRLVGGG